MVKVRRVQLPAPAGSASVVVPGVLGQDVLACRWPKISIRSVHSAHVFEDRAGGCGELPGPVRIRNRNREAWLLGSSVGSGSAG